MKLTVVYVYFNTPNEIQESINSIDKAVGKNSYEIIVVDNNSTKKIPRALFRDKRVTIIKSKTNGGFGYGCNLGAKSATGEYILFLNPDTVLFENSVVTMLKTFTDMKKVGIVGPLMVDGKENNLPTINTFITFGRAIVAYSFVNKLFPKNIVSKKFWMLEKDRTKLSKVDVISGACMLIKKDLFEKIGGFDERFFMYFEEQDLCLRIVKEGYKVIFNPRGVISHKVGASLSDKKVIKIYFQKSRFLYFKKHLGIFPALFAEFILRFLTFKNLLISVPFIVSLVINLYRQDSLMLLIGDSARDFLAARDMILSGSIPIVGIPSSAPWLHQGPTSVWLIGLAFFFSKFNPVAPAVLFGFLGAITTFLVWYLGYRLFNEKVGFIASLLYATSPLIAVNARMPYHTSLIPFFAAIFFILLINTLKNKRYLPFLFFSFGLTLLVELSNVVIFGIIFVLFFFFKKKLQKKDYVKMLGGFILGVFPFVLYDFLHGFTYLKFPLWIVNRIRLFFFNSSHVEGIGFSLSTLTSIYQEIAASILPIAGPLSIGLFIAGIILLFNRVRKKGDRKPYAILLVWLLLPLFSFALHSSPGQAYFTLLFPAIALLIGFLLYSIFRISRNVAIVLTTGILFINTFSLFNNEFFVFTQNGAHLMPPMNYSLGYSWRLSDNASKAITDDARGKKFTLQAAGIFKLYATSLDPYIYMTWFHGGKYSLSSDLVYMISDDPNDLKDQKIIYKSNFEYVARK